MINGLSSKFINVALLLGNCAAAIYVIWSGLAVLSEGYEDGVISALQVRLRTEAVVNMLAATGMSFAALLRWRGRNGARYVLLSCQFYFVARMVVEAMAFVIQTGTVSLPPGQALLLVLWIALLALNYLASSASSFSSGFMAHRPRPGWVGRVFLCVHWVVALLLGWPGWLMVFHEIE